MHRFSEEFSGFQFCEGEELRMVIRRHWIVNSMSLIGGIFWGIILPGIVFGLYWYFHGVGGDKITAMLLVTIGVYSSVTFLALLVRWLNHAFDVIIVTNDRVIDITQVDFFHRNVLEARLINVQDATGDVNGFFHTLFDWGKIEVRTANDVADFSIEMVEHPHQKAREIFDIAREAQESDKRKGFEIQHTLQASKKKQQKKENKEKEIADRRALFSPKAYRLKINDLLGHKK